MQKSYYAIIPANVRYDNDLPPNAKLLYGEITALCNERGYCWAGNAYFSELYKVTNRTISSWINDLEQKGYITRNIIRNSETKQVEQRIIRLAAETSSYPIEDNFLPSGNNLHDPIEDNFRKNNTSINNTSNKDKYLDEFNQFWSIYPKKVRRKPSESSFIKARKNHSLETILEGTKKYANHVKNKDKKFILYPTTFLNSEAFIDGIDEEENINQLTKPKQQPKQEESVLADLWGDEY